MLTIRDLAWTAGFLDGEGSFRLRKVRLSSARGGASPEVTAPQVDRELLDRLASLFGGAVYFRDKGRGIHVWTLSGPQAIGLMMTLYPLLSMKRRVQIREAITEWRARPGTGATNRAKTACPRGHPYDTIVQRKTGPARRCSICYRAWWAENGSRYRRARRAGA